MSIATINTTNARHTVCITDTNQHGDKLRVTVREMYGHGCAPANILKSARALARRAMKGVKRSQVVRSFMDGPCQAWTFELSSE